MKEIEKLLEETLSAAERKKLRVSTFGLPEEKKYPLNDPTHVSSAITYFSKCPIDKQEQLAHNIIKAIKKFKMSPKVSEDNPFSKYYNNEN